MQVVKYQNRYTGDDGIRFVHWSRLSQKNKHTDSIWEVYDDYMCLQYVGYTIIIDIKAFKHVQSNLVYVCLTRKPYAWIEQGSTYGFLHHLILPKKEGLFTDHINGNSLDNRLINLRYATPSQNAFNKPSQEGSTSRYKGVSKAGKKWRAQLQFNKKKIQIGYFPTELEALDAYEAKAKELFGEFYTPQNRKD